MSIGASGWRVSAIFSILIVPPHRQLLNESTRLTAPALIASGTVVVPPGSDMSRAYPVKSFVIRVSATSHPEPQSPFGEIATSASFARFITTPWNRSIEPSPSFGQFGRYSVEHRSLPSRLTCPQWHSSHSPSSGHGPQQDSSQTPSSFMPPSGMPPSTLLFGPRRPYMLAKCSFFDCFIARVVSLCSERPISSHVCSSESTE